MEAAESKIFKTYLRLLKQLNPRMRKRLVSELTVSLESEPAEVNLMDRSFGSWHSEETAEELINQIESNRHTDRKIEGF